MKSLLKNFALSTLNSAPVYGALRARTMRGNPITILCYHTLRPDHEQLDAWIALKLSDFRAQIAILRETYDIVSLGDALEPAESGARPRAVLTFDDGEIGLYTHLLPIVEQENLPVTVYVATRQIETGQPYWFDRVMNALQGDGATHIDMRAAGLSSWTVGPERGKHRWYSISAILEALKNAPPEQRDSLSDQVIAQTTSIGTDFTPLAPMTVNHLKTLSNNENITIGAHTHCHSLLDQLPITQAIESIGKSVKLLQNWTGKPIRHFAYPNGNHTPELHREIEALGLRSATILDMQLAQETSNPFALSRLGVGRYDSPKRFRLRLVNI